MCAARKSVLLINAGRFSLAAALALVITAAAPGKADNPSKGSLDLAGLAGNVVLALLGIDDAMAGKGNNGNSGGGGNDNGGYQAGCSGNTTSNSPNSAHCKNNDDSDGGDAGGGGSADGGGGGGGADGGGSGGGAGGGANGAVASFTFCDSGHHGASGRLFELYANGRTAITKVRCN